MAITAIEELVKNQTWDETPNDDFAVNMDAGSGDFGESTGNLSFTATRVYQVFGANDPLDAKIAVYPPNPAPIVIQIPPIGMRYDDPLAGIVPVDADDLVGIYNIVCTDISVENETLDNIHVVTCTFTNTRSSKDEKWTLTDRGETIETNYCISQTRYPTTEAKDIKNIVGLASDGSISGVSIPSDTEELVVTRWIQPSVFNTAKINQLRNLKNQLNDDTFYGQPAESVMFRGYTIVRLVENFLLEVEFKFWINPKTLIANLPEFYKKDNTTKITITDDKEGWDYLWIQNAEAPSGTKTITYTQGVYLAKMFQQDISNFSDLGVSGRLYSADPNPY